MSPSTFRGWGVTGAILAMLAVILGAFGAHGLPDHFEKLYQNTPPKVIAGVEVPAAHKYLEDFKTGADYQFGHAIALLLVSAFRTPANRRWLDAAGWLFLVGIMLFSGSLFLLSTLAIPVLGAVAPFGGTSLIVGWVAFAIGLTRPAGDENQEV